MRCDKVMQRDTAVMQCNDTMYDRASYKGTVVFVHKIIVHSYSYSSGSLSFG